jgi:hypothetical protein
MWRRMRRRRRRRSRRRRRWVLGKDGHFLRAE